MSDCKDQPLIAKFVDELYRMAVASILNREHISKSLDILKDIHSKGADVICSYGGIALIVVVIVLGKNLNLEIRWKNSFKEGCIKLSANDKIGT